MRSGPQRWHGFLLHFVGGDLRTSIYELGGLYRLSWLAVPFFGTTCRSPPQLRRPGLPTSPESRISAAVELQRSADVRSGKPPRTRNCLETKPLKAQSMLGRSNIGMNPIGRGAKPPSLHFITRLDPASEQGAVTTGTFGERERLRRCSPTGEKGCQLFMQK